MSEEKEIMLTIGLKNIQGPVTMATREDEKEVMEKLEKAISSGSQCLIEGEEGQKLLISGAYVGFVKVDPVVRPMMGYMRTY
ncbi:MAG: DUF3107 family protein [Aeriscardovia sp.]|nr:DUF3107 family protein [Aeriscardovia sp.]